MNHTPSKMNLFSFTGKTRILHLSWFAFFLTFVVWFNHAPLMASIRDKFLTLPDDTVVMSGHGPNTTIGHERITNPFIMQYLQ